MDEFVHQPMMTYIGNKRKLVEQIGDELKTIQQALQKDKLDLVDGFCGSTVVARSMVPYAKTLITNDLELYSYLMAQCFLKEPDGGSKARISHHIEKMNNLSGVKGIISTHYAPADDQNIQMGERCFYTTKNAEKLDAMRKYIDEEVEDELRPYCLAPLLVKASIHTNTSGVFKGFYKNKEGLGCYGGDGKNALSRITGDIGLDVPKWHGQCVEVECHQKDIQEFAEQLPCVDVVYLDPPYNQHPYGSNYFMLNTIATNEIGDSLSKVSGIPKKWNKSNYNYKSKAKESLQKLLETLKGKTKYVILSYNNEGIISTDELQELLQPYAWTKREIDYSAFKGSRNLASRSKRVVELMYTLCL